MRNCIFLLILAGATTLGMAGRAPAQSAQSAPTSRVGRPVDQNVGDVDPLATSLRRMDRGNARFPTRSMMVRNPYAASWKQVDRSFRQRRGGVARRRYTFRGPGVTALVDRPQYLAIGRDGKPDVNVAAFADGAFKELAPPNAVYSLIPDYPSARRSASKASNMDGKPQTQAQSRARVSRRKAGRVQGQVDRRVHWRINQSAGATNENPSSNSEAQASRLTFAQIVRQRIRREQKAESAHLSPKAHESKRP